MDIREATNDDRDGIQHAARESLQASYGHALSEDVIEEAVDHWYGDEMIDELDDEDALYLVAVEDDEIVGFSQSYLTGEDGTAGEIDWIHIDPDHRGSGYGSRLLDETELALVDRGVTYLQGKVLVDNESGAEFYVSHGYEPGHERDVDIGGETHTERTFVKLPGQDGEGEQEAPLDRRELDDGTPIYVAYDEGDRGSLSPFYAAYHDDNREELYGYFCGHCEGFDIAMDAMGRVECNTCDNKRKPSRWDASYL